MRRLTRRGFARGAVAAVGGLLGWKWLRSRSDADGVPWPLRAVHRLNERLQPLTSFILPGGSPASAWCHLARTVCRRAEREVVTLMHLEPVNSQVMIYLNRLSDLLFVLARAATQRSSEVA